ncbi:hypothetical protein SY83_04430 [Paenibacillus swuensis]|uniref:AraC family transcriptional regulator n=1 Tax=Paenibacillus swuensis TaxID=1178515 RepID=A0A172TF81_9BACL|nr:response regulator [Paenibacillus swuensis]ANE45670.1 hypothetical protein SY83_04430 [Paenibacillus swuensis]
MYRILIADDERLILDSLVDFVDWKSLSMEVAATAKNGKEALRLTAIHRPDLILTDVKMPIMDGLEFAAEARRLYPHVKIVFLSGYDEFTYIKQALTIQASDYLLKPIDFAELNKVMRDAVRSLEKDKFTEQDVDLRRMKLWKQMLLEKEPVLQQKFMLELEQVMPSYSFERTQLRLACMLLEPVYNHGSVVAWLLDSTLLKAQSITVIEMKEGELALLSSGDKAAFEDRTFLTELNIRLQEKFNTAAAIGTGLKAYSITELPRQYDVCRQFAEHRFYAGSDALLTPMEIHLPADADVTVSLEGITARLGDAIRNGDEQLTIQHLAEHFQVLHELLMDKHWVCSHAYQLLLGVYGELFSSDGELPFLLGSRTSLWGQISKSTTALELQSLLTDRFKAMIRHLLLRDRDRYTQVVNQVKQFVEDNLGRPLTLNDLAQQVYLSPNYLRSVFKEKTGVTLHDFITDTKMRKATELLKDHSLKIHEISNRIGYENVSYFCSLFQRHKGTTPNEYRKKLL